MKDTFQLNISKIMPARQKKRNDIEGFEEQYHHTQFLTLEHSLECQTAMSIRYRKPN